MFELKNCSLTIAKRNLIKAVNLSIPPGQLTTIVGPNGAGKSTLLKLLSGELVADEGEVWLNQKKLGAYSSRELARCRSVVTQFHAIAFPYSCYDIIAMASDGQRTNQKKDRKDPIHCAMTLLDIHHLAHQPFDRLSGGEQQRVICARALTQIDITNDNLTGKMVILDEPTASLDIKHQFLLFNLLKQLTARGASIIMVVHDLNHALNYSDSVVLLHRGTIICHQAPDMALRPENIQQYFSASAELLQTQAGNRHLAITA